MGKSAAEIVYNDIDGLVVGLAPDGHRPGETCACRPLAAITLEDARPDVDVPRTVWLHRREVPSDAPDHSVLLAQERRRRYRERQLEARA